MTRLGLSRVRCLLLSVPCCLLSPSLSYCLPLRRRVKGELRCETKVVKSTYIQSQGQVTSGTESDSEGSGGRIVSLGLGGRFRVREGMWAVVFLPGFELY